MFFYKLQRVMMRGVAVLLLLFINRNYLAAVQLPICSAISEVIEGIKFPDLLNLNQYYVCENGNLIVRSCEIGEIFDSYKLECASSIAGKEKHELIDLTAYYVKKFNVKDVLSKLIMNGIGDELECQRHQFYKTAFPTNCKKYYECNHGLLKVYSCFLPFNFDPVSHQCKWYWLVDCKVHSTKTTASTKTSLITAQSVSTVKSTSPSQPLSTDLTLGPQNQYQK